MRAPAASVTGWLLFRAELVLMKAQVSLFCFGRKYFKPSFIEKWKEVSCGLNLGHSCELSGDRPALRGGHT